MHSIYDDLVPEQSRLFHYLLSQCLDAGDMPPWPGETEEPELEQLRLFCGEYQRKRVFAGD